MIQVIRNIQEMQNISGQLSRNGKRIGLVPTMGALHEGHLSLIPIACEKSDKVVVSIFINPIQFLPGEDYEKYPRNLKKDIQLVEETGGDIVFAPEVNDLYTENHSTYVNVEGITEILCGASRPGHFRGVITVVCKLFNIVQPAVAVFGQKDFQQVVVIKRMVHDLNIPCEIIMGPVIRESDGLAMSSRNMYLSPEERIDARLLFASLQHAERMVLEGEVRTEVVCEKMQAIINQSSLASIDYIEIIDPWMLKPLKKITTEAVAVLAVKFGDTRLIDNIILKRTSN